MTALGIISCLTLGGYALGLVVSGVMEFGLTRRYAIGLTLGVLAILYGGWRVFGIFP